jgi:hypothetical protein
VQIGFAYGCGQLCGFKGYKKNAVKVPNPKFTYKNDPSRFVAIIVISITLWLVILADSSHYIATFFQMHLCAKVEIISVLNKSIIYYS